MKKNFLLFTESLILIVLILSGCSGTTPVIKDHEPVLGESVPFSLVWENSSASKLNLSFMHDKPAGKDGFIRVGNGHLIRPSGERFRIWGVNLTGGACFPDKKDAAAYAAFLARFGINAVRFHFLDSHGGQERTLFNNSLATTRELFPEQLDKLDFFISELKKAGIYSNINLNVGRTYRKDDGVPEYDKLGFGKWATIFNDRLVFLQKEYARQLLTHVNPYTGNAYIHEPAVAVIEILNENSLVEGWFGGKLTGNAPGGNSSTWDPSPPYYCRELTRKYNAWLKKNISQDELGKICKEAGVGTGEEVPQLSPKGFKDASRLRFHTEASFIMETERDFFLDMYKYLKEELGARSLIIASSDHNHSRSGYPFLSNASRLDIADGHVYWQHPEQKTDKKTGARYSTIENTPMVNNPGFSTVVQLSRSAVEGKPYTVSETNHPYPNEYACEGIPILSAYALLQDWDGIFWYTLEHNAPHLWNEKLPGSFDICMDPVKMAQIAACGLMYLRNDLKPAETCVFRGYSKSRMIEGIREPYTNRPYFTDGFPVLSPLIQRTRIRSFEEDITGFPEVKEKPEINAATGEIRWHVSDRSFVEISSPRSESLVGYLSGETSLVKHLKVSLENDFAAITLISLDGEPIETAGKLLLVTAGKSGVTGMTWNDERTRLTEPGTKPTTIEAIRGKITLTGLTKTKLLVAEPLDGSGNPLSKRVIRVKNGTAGIDIRSDGTMWYYLTGRQTK